MFLRVKFMAGCSLIRFLIGFIMVSQNVFVKLIPVARINTVLLKIPGNSLSGCARESPLAPRPREPVRTVPPRGSPLHHGDPRGDIPRRLERIPERGRRT